MLRTFKSVFLALIALALTVPDASAKPEVFIQATFAGTGKSALGTINLKQTGQGTTGTEIKFSNLDVTDPVSVGLIEWNYTMSADEGYRFVSVTKHRRNSYGGWQSTGETLTTYELAHYALAFSINQTEEDFLLKATVEFTGTTPRNGTVMISGWESERGTIMARRTTVDDYTSAKTYLPVSYFQYDPRPLAIETGTTEPQIGFMINPDSEEGKLHRYLYSVKVNDKEVERTTYKYKDEYSTRRGCFPVLKDGDEVYLQGFAPHTTHRVRLPMGLVTEANTYPDIRRRPEDRVEVNTHVHPFDAPAWGTMEFKLDDLNYTIHSVTLGSQTLTPDKDGWYVIEDINQDLTVEADADRNTLHELTLRMYKLQLDLFPALYIDNQKMELAWEPENEIPGDDNPMMITSLIVKDSSKVRFAMNDNTIYKLFTDEDDRNFFVTFFQDGDYEYEIQRTQEIKLEAYPYQTQSETLQLTVTPASLADYMPEAGMVSKTINDDTATVTYNLQTKSQFEFSYPADLYTILDMSIDHFPGVWLSCIEPTNTVNGNQGTISYGPLYGSIKININSYRRSYITIESNIPEATDSYILGKKKYGNDEFIFILEDDVETSSTGSTKIEYTPSQEMGMLVFFSDDYYVTNVELDGKPHDSWYAGKYSFPYSSHHQKFVQILDLKSMADHTLKITAVPKADISVRLHAPENYKMPESTNFYDWPRQMRIVGYENRVPVYERVYNSNDYLKGLIEVYDYKIKTGDHVSIHIPGEVKFHDDYFGNPTFEVPSILGSEFKAYTLNPDGSRHYLEMTLASHEPGSYLPIYEVAFHDITSDIDIYFEMPEPDFSYVQFKPGFEPDVDVAAANIHVLRANTYVWDESDIDTFTEIFPDEKGVYNLSWPYGCEYYVVSSLNVKSDSYGMGDDDILSVSHHCNIWELTKFTCHKREDGDITDVVFKHNDQLAFRDYKLNYADDVPQFARDYIDALPLTRNQDLIIPSVVTNPANPEESFTLSRVIYLYNNPNYIYDHIMYKLYDVDEHTGCSLVEQMHASQDLFPSFGLDFCCREGKDYVIWSGKYKDDNTVWIGGTLPDFNGTGALDSITGDSSAAQWPADVHSIDGRLILRAASAEQVRSLQPGVYIVGGRKLILK